MEVSSKTLREIEFREKMRGYHPEDVDSFLEQVAAGIDVLQDRLRQAVERAQRAEAVASDGGSSDETLRKTLVLAQRTADMAVQEAREQAARILASAEQQAQAVLADAEERGRRTLEDTITECKTELARLEGIRAQAQQDVDNLQRWLDEHKAHLQASLSDALAAVGRAGVVWPTPTTNPVELGVSVVSKTAIEYAPTVMPSGETAGSAEPSGPASDPDTVIWGPEDQTSMAAPPQPSAPPPAYDGPGPNDALWPDPGAGQPGVGQPGVGQPGPNAEERAMDDFFHEDDGFADGRRQGGRLRRRH